ncbi:cyclopropane-fatty-acyl-phospholipid synthase family protein [Pikeienuella sp. HZG-20]|uniref:cyclopropane-fatty-acyl-phospholipid synthase family protein n=1 Tax=Paludibacillus litoralis TaxID=3133267 RepID=UPI0030EE34CE
MSEKKLDRMLSRGVRTGAVEMVYPSGEVRRYGDGSAPVARLRIADSAAVRGIWMDPALKVPELYMEGRLVVEEGDLFDFLILVKKNGARGFVTFPSMALGVGRMLNGVLRRHLLPERAKRNVAHHYDLDERLFRLFLDEDLQYSCAYYETGDETLEEAQRKKKRHIAAKMQLEPGRKVLDIGCGWGGMGLYLARVAGVGVTGVTLAEEQLRVAKERAKAAGMEKDATFLLQDYRKVEGRFDRIVSVGMFEHVGSQNYDEYFRTIERLLTDDGIAVVHAIVRAKPNRFDAPFIDKYIFPNGHIPSLGETFPAIEKTKLLVKDVEILTMHYADTLKEWRKRFHANREAALALYDERFFRMWDLYLMASEISFRYGKLANFQIVLTRRHAEAPRSRAYIAAAEAELAAAEARVDAEIAAGARAPATAPGLDAAGGGA